MHKLTGIITTLAAVVAMGASARTMSVKTQSQTAVTLEFGAADGKAYTLPAELKADGMQMRFFLMKSKNLPYARELASVTSTGAQWVQDVHSVYEVAQYHIILKSGLMIIHR